MPKGKKPARSLERGHAVRGIVERAKGMFKSDKPPLTAEQVRQVGEEAFAVEAAEGSNQALRHGAIDGLALGVGGDYIRVAALDGSLTVPD